MIYYYCSLKEFIEKTKNGNFSLEMHSLITKTQLLNQTQNISRNLYYEIYKNNKQKDTDITDYDAFVNIYNEDVSNFFYKSVFTNSENFHLWKTLNDFQGVCIEIDQNKLDLTQYGITLETVCYSGKSVKEYVWDFISTIKDYSSPKLINDYLKHMVKYRCSQIESIQEKLFISIHNQESKIKFKIEDGTIVPYIELPVPSKAINKIFLGSKNKTEKYLFLVFLKKNGLNPNCYVKYDIQDLPF